MAKAVWRNAVIAESDAFEVVEGNVYFPLAAVKAEHLAPSDSHTTCAWKGVASYYDVVVGDERNRDAAWYYPTPSAAAAQIKDHVAFWRGVVVTR
ncbi:MAG: DUF427 domain-containing protein [Myxococcota bacterium]